MEAPSDDDIVHEGEMCCCDFFREIDCPYFRKRNVLFLTVTTEGFSQFFKYVEGQELVMMSHRVLPQTEYSFLIVVLNNIIIVTYLNSSADFDENEFIQFVRLLSEARSCISCDPEDDKMSCFKVLGDKYGIGDFQRLMLRPEIGQETEKREYYNKVEECWKDYCDGCVSESALYPGKGTDGTMSIKKEGLKALVAKPLMMFVLESQIRGIYGKDDGLGMEQSDTALSDDFLMLKGGPQYLALHKNKFSLVSIWEEGKWDADTVTMLEEINHPSVLKYYGKVDNKLVITEPVIKWNVFQPQGKSVRTLSAGEQFLLMSLYTDLVFGLEFVHRNGYVFQNFSQQDIAMGQDGRCKIACLCGCKKVFPSDVSYERVSYELVSQELRLMYKDVSVASSVYQQYLCTNGTFKHREPVAGDNIIDLLWHAIECNILTLNPMLLQRTCELLDYQTSKDSAYQKVVSCVCDDIYQRIVAAELDFGPLPMKLIRQGMMTKREYFDRYKQMECACAFQEELRAIQGEVADLYPDVSREGSQPDLTDDEKQQLLEKPPRDYLNYYYSPDQLPMRDLDSCLKGLSDFLRMVTGRAPWGENLRRIVDNVCETVKLLNELSQRVKTWSKSFEALGGARARTFLNEVRNLEQDIAELNRKKQK